MRRAVAEETLRNVTARAALARHDAERPLEKSLASSRRGARFPRRDEPSSRVEIGIRQKIEILNIADERRKSRRPERRVAEFARHNALDEL